MCIQVCFYLYLKWACAVYVLQLLKTNSCGMVFLSMLDMKVCLFLFFNSYIIVGCTIIYLIVPLLLDIWVIWNMNKLI